MLQVRILLFLSHVLLLLSVCGLPPTSRRSQGWSPGSNPKREAVLWALLFPAQVWVSTFGETTTSIDSLSNASHLTVPHAATLHKLDFFWLCLNRYSFSFMVSFLAVKNTQTTFFDPDDHCSRNLHFICLLSENLTLSLIMFNISATGAFSMWPTCHPPDYRVNSQITGNSCLIKLWKHSGSHDD